LKKRKWLIDILLVIVIVILGYLIYREVKGRSEPKNSSVVDVKTNEQASNVVEEVSSEVDVEAPVEIYAPDFSLENLVGESIALSEFRGYGVIVNFWATWCPPCRAEMPLFGEVADQHTDTLVVLAVNSAEERVVVQEFAKGYSSQLVFLLDSDNAVGELYRVRGLPTTYFIDAKGLLQAMHIGELDESLLIEYLKVIGIGQ
jgi:thiol-disulfide isomerase/thioredoxin